MPNTLLAMIAVAFAVAVLVFKVVDASSPRSLSRSAVQVANHNVVVGLVLLAISFPGVVAAANAAHAAPSTTTTVLAAMAIGLALIGVGHVAVGGGDRVVPLLHRLLDGPPSKRAPTATADDGPVVVKPLH